MFHNLCYGDYHCWLGLGITFFFKTQFPFQLPTDWGCVRATTLGLIMDYLTLDDHWALGRTGTHRIGKSVAGHSGTIGQGTWSHHHLCSFCYI